MTKKLIHALICVITIALVSLAFFYPDAAKGNLLRQHDIMQGAANGHEAELFREATGEKTWWTNSLFSGMPVYQISPTYESNSLYDWITSVYGLGLPSPSNLLFMMMAGFLILMAAMRVRWYVALLGAIAWGLSSYFVIIIGAGHIWKFVTLAYIPPTIGGIIMAYNGRRLTGAAIAALFAMMQIASNHLQMTYYFLMVIAALVIAYFVRDLRSKQLRSFGLSTGALAVAAILAVSANLPSLWNTYQYSKQTMRGAHSELAAARPADATSGLDRSYITQYSYGQSESFSLIIPDIKGGASAKPVGGHMEALTLADLPDVKTMEESHALNDVVGQYLNYVSQYFGEPEGTNGPVYVGAVVFALFIFGAIRVRGAVKWALGAMTVLSLLLAMGRNAQWLTDLFIDYFPAYSKFRTVESILVIAEFTIPLLAVMGLMKLVSAPDDERRQMLRPLAWSFGTVAFFCLAALAVPSLYGDVITDTDRQTSMAIGQQLMSQGYPAEAVTMFSLDNPEIYRAVTSLREGMIRSDALRSLIFVVLGFALCAAYATNKMRSAAATSLALAALVLIDLYSVDKRYLSSESFVPEQLTHSDPFPLSQSDRQILADTTSHYRVMNVPEFWSATPSYHHKTIGGYHAAKLTRYQDLIDTHLTPMLAGRPTNGSMTSLAMLNARYIVGRDGSVTLNPLALGNAWLVDTLIVAQTPDREIDLLDEINPATTAVASPDMAERLGKVAPAAEGDTIRLTSYAPNRLTYHAETRQGATAVFSEVYYPRGWRVEIDGKEIEEAPARVNYLLRAINIPAGSHTVVMSFEPRDVSTTVAIARVAVIAIYLLVALALFFALKPLIRKK